jgi:hypothetical protein
MPIRLPKILDVPDHFGVSIVQRSAKNQRGMNTGFRVSIPQGDSAQIRWSQRENRHLAGKHTCGFLQVTIRRQRRNGLQPGPYLNEKVWSRSPLSAEESKALKIYEAFFSDAM